MTARNCAFPWQCPVSPFTEPVGKDKVNPAITLIALPFEPKDVRLLDAQLTFTHAGRNRRLAKVLPGRHRSLNTFAKRDLKGGNTLLSFYSSNLSL
jgi:hypothetical protein